MKSVSRLVLAIGILAAGLMVAAPAAQAITFDFTSDHCTGGCGTPPFGTVTLTQNGTTVDVTVQLNSPNFYVKTGAGDDQAFKFNGIDIVLGDITVDAHTPALIAATGSFNGDGGGEYDFGITCPTCANGAAGKFNADILFHVANATIADLTVPNNLGQIFVADIISCSVATCGSGSGTGNTGLVDVSGTPVAEPSSLFFFGSVMALAGMLGRRWKHR